MENEEGFLRLLADMRESSLSKSEQRMKFEKLMRKSFRQVRYMQNCMNRCGDGLNSLCKYT